jgi:Kinesin motor domain
LDHIAKRAQIDASNRFHSYPSEGDIRYDESTVAQIDIENIELTESTVQGLEEMDIDEDFDRSIDPAQERVDRTHDNLSDRLSSSKSTTARVIDINAKAGCLTMHIAGMGVRPFHFSNLYDGDASQSSVYYSSSSDSVAAALNGYNSCVLCYGQTGKANPCIKMNVHLVGCKSLHTTLLIVDKKQ